MCMDQDTTDGGIFLRNEKEVSIVKDHDYRQPPIGIQPGSPTSLAIGCLATGMTDKGILLFKGISYDLRPGVGLIEIDLR